MATSTDDLNESRWIDERLRALTEHGEFQPDMVRGWALLQQRQAAKARGTRRVWAAAAMAAATAGLVVALPWPRAAAQRLWDRLSLGRFEVLQVSGKDLPESVTALFVMESAQWSVQPLNDANDAERV